MPLNLVILLLLLHYDYYHYYCYYYYHRHHYYCYYYWRVKASGLFKLCLAIVAALGYGMVTQYTY